VHVGEQRLGAVPKGDALDLDDGAAEGAAVGEGKRERHFFLFSQPSKKEGIEERVVVVKRLDT